ncbi:hypothetical protein BH11CYA1_BH11CYA1_36540 [soil metagenome]
MFRQILLCFTIYFAIALPGWALTGEEYYKTPPSEFLECIAESPRGKDDPIVLAKRVPIIFSEDGHVLVTDTDGEPYPSSFEQAMHQKMKEDCFYSNRICQQSVGLTEAELISWLGKPFPQTGYHRVKGGKELNAMTYLLGGGQIPMILEMVDGRCLRANCGFKWNSDQIGESKEIFDTKSFEGETDAELFALLGDLLKINGKPIKSLAELPAPSDSKYVGEFLDYKLEIKDHKCVNVLITLEFGNIFRPYIRPHK